jgi:hypothetical protein
MSEGRRQTLERELEVAKANVLDKAKYTPEANYDSQIEYIDMLSLGVSSEKTIDEDDYDMYKRALAVSLRHAEDTYQGTQRIHIRAT